jgi:hypothetical protein
MMKLHGLGISTMLKVVRSVGLVAVLAAFAAPHVRAARLDDCTQTTDCGQGSGTPVCVNLECTSCLDDPGQCQAYQWPGGDLQDPFCDGSGRCFESSDCGNYYVGNTSENGCTNCNDSGALSCLYGYGCDPDSSCVFEF